MKLAFDIVLFVTANPDSASCVERCATLLSFLLVIITFPFSLFECFKVGHSDNKHYLSTKLFKINSQYASLLMIEILALVLNAFLR